MTDVMQVLRVIDSLGGSITGRLCIQKICYILTYHGLELPSATFKFLHYGPYSHTVFSSLELLTSWKALEQEEIVIKEDSLTKETKVAHRYAITSTGIDLLNKVVDFWVASYPRPEVFVLFKEASQEALNTLSTYYYAKDRVEDQDIWKYIADINANFEKSLEEAIDLKCSLDKLSETLRTGETIHEAGGTHSRN